MKKAKEKLRELSATSEARQIAQMRLDGRRDYVTDMRGEREAGKAEGYIEGRAEGRVEGKRETSRALLANLLADSDTATFSVSRLARVTGLSEAEVTAFLRELESNPR